VRALPAPPVAKARVPLPEVRFTGLWDFPTGGRGAQIQILSIRENAAKIARTWLLWLTDL